MKKNRISLLLCAAILALNVMSCADTADTGKTDETKAPDAPVAETTAAVTEEEEKVIPYNYELTDLGGYERSGSRKQLGKPADRTHRIQR